VSDESAGAAHQFPLLDPLRGIAAMSILLVHTSLWSKAQDNRGYGRFFAHLDIGVPFFFVLSAFLLYRPFVQARVARTPRTPFRDYGRRRFVRIAPPYWAALTITAIIPGMVGAFTGNWWVYYGLLQNFPVFTPRGVCADPFGTARCGIPVAWSLSIEVMFYLCLPLFVLAMAWLGRRRWGGLVMLALSAVAIIPAISVVIQAAGPKTGMPQSLFASPLGRGWGLGLAVGAAAVLFVLAMVWVGWRWRGGLLTLELSAVALITAISVVIQASVPKSSIHQWLFYSPLGRGWWFGLGLGMAAVSVDAGMRRSEPGFVQWLRRHPNAPVVGGIVLYAWAAGLLLEPRSTLAFPFRIDKALYVAQYLLFGVIVALFMLPAVFGTDGGGFVRRVLRNRTLVWFGLVSYGIFLWHFPVLILLLDHPVLLGYRVTTFVPLTVLTCVITVACASVSYYVLERPLMRWVRRRHSGLRAA
jgi:peptidoglycan/LPS O-acetylase OafA/YrhL